MAAMISTDDRFGISFKKLAKGVGKGISKGAKGVAKGAKAVGKVAVSAALLPFKLAMAAVIKLAIPLGRALCMAPPPILSVGAASAGVSMNVVPMFCTALNLRNMGEVRRLLPPVLKIAVKVAATGAVPGVGPALSAIRVVPGLKLIPGLKFLAGADANDDLAMSDINNFGYALAQMSDEELAGAIDEMSSFGAATLTPNVGYGVGVGVGALALATGLLFAFRR